MRTLSRPVRFLRDSVTLSESSNSAVVPEADEYASKAPETSFEEKSTIWRMALARPSAVSGSIEHEDFNRSLGSMSY